MEYIKAGPGVEGDIQVRPQGGVMYQLPRNHAESPAPKYPTDYSLREYCKFLYRVPRMRIHIMGSPVKCMPVEKELSLFRKRKYRHVVVGLSFDYRSDGR